MNEKTRCNETFLGVTIAARCFDVAIGVRCRLAEAEAVTAHLPVGSTLISPTLATHLFVLTARAENEALFSVRCGSSRRASAPQTLASALNFLQKQIHLCVAEHAQKHVFVHAGVVVWKNNTLVFPGSSHAGKSTLVWSLIQDGAVYYSDEYAVFDEEGFVHPFPLPISLRLDGGNRRMIMPEVVGLSRRKPDLVLFARYRAGATWSPRLLQPAAAVMQLIRHSIAIRSNPALVIPVLKQVSLQAQAFKSARGQLQQVGQWMGLLNK